MNHIIRLHVENEFLSANKGYSEKWKVTNQGFLKWKI